MTQQLPPGWATRRPTLADRDGILALVHASDIAAVGEPDFTAEEITEILLGPHHDPQRDSWLAIDGYGRIVGWSYVVNPTGSRRDNLDVYVHPERGVAAVAPLLGWLVERIGERAGELGYPTMTARAGAIASETRYISALRSAGFTFVKRYARMRRDLSGGEQLPRARSGISIRPVRHEDDVEMRVFHSILETAFAELPDYQPASYEAYRARLTTLAGISWDEWFVGEVDGVPAGILESAEQPGEQNEGWVRNLAVANESRGRGLGGMLLRTAFAAYAGKGRTAAGLAVDMTNPTRAYRLYEGVGMHPVYEADIYQREVAATEVAAT